MEELFNDAEKGTKSDGVKIYLRACGISLSGDEIVTLKCLMLSAED